MIFNQRNLTVVIILFDSLKNVVKNIVVKMTQISFLSNKQLSQRSIENPDDRAKIVIASDYTLSNFFSK